MCKNVCSIENKHSIYYGQSLHKQSKLMQCKYTNIQMGHYFEVGKCRTYLSPISASLQSGNVNSVPVGFAISMCRSGFAFKCSFTAFKTCLGVCLPSGKKAKQFVTSSFSSSLYLLAAGHMSLPSSILPWKTDS